MSDHEKVITAINSAMKVGATFIVYEMDGCYIAEVQKNGYPIEQKKGASPLDAILNLNEIVSHVWIFWVYSFLCCFLFYIF